MPDMTLTLKGRNGDTLAKTQFTSIYSTLATAAISGVDHTLVAMNTVNSDGEKRMLTGYVENSVLAQLDVTNVQLPSNFAGLEGQVIPTRLKEQLFEITNVVEGDDYVEITAQHIFYRLRQNTTLWEANEGLEYTGAAVCRNVVTNAMFDAQVYVASDCTDTMSGKDLDYARLNIVEAFLNPESGICKKFGLSIIRDNDVFYCLKDVGYDRGFVVQDGKNLLGVERTVNIENTVTRLAPVARDEDGNIVWLSYNGLKYVDSPHVTDYSRPKLGIFDTGLRIGKDGVTTDNVQAKLLEAAQKQFTENQVDLPAVTMTIQFLSLGDTEEYSQYRNLDKVYLYDILSIKDSVRGYSYQAEVVGVEHDILTGRLNAVTIGTLQDWDGIRKVATWQVPEVNGEKIRLKSIQAGSFQANVIGASEIRSGAIQSQHFSQSADGHFETIFAEQLYISNTSPDGLLNTRFSVSEGNITALVEKTGIDYLPSGTSIYGQLEVEAGKVAMVVGTNSGGNYIKAAEIAVAVNNAGQGVALINADHVNISATSTAHLLAGSISYDANGNLVLKESSGGGVVIERTEGQTTTKYGVFDNGNLTAGVIATKVNGESSTYIYGSNIVMSSTDSTAVNVAVNGKLTTTDLTAKIAEIQIVSMRSVAIDSNGYINSGGYIYAPEFVIGSNSSQGGSNKYVSNAITELQVVETSSGSGVYKIQKKDFGDSSWVDVTGNFSGAASVDFSSESLWSNGNKTLTLTNSKTHTVSIPTPSNYSGTYIGPVQDDPTMSVTVMVGGAAFNGQISASGAYNAGVTAGEGKFSPASPTLQGTQISGTVYHSVDSPNGVVYYTAGAKVKSTTLYADAGSEYLYKASAEATYYTNGTKAKKASGVTLTREYNWGTLYYWDNDRGDFLPIKTAYWYSSQYQLGATATAFEGSNVYVPDSNGSLYICAGSETLQKAINGGWYYKRSSSGTTCYVADNSGTTNLISSTSIRIAAVAAGYYGGSQVTNTYYTKT